MEVFQNNMNRIKTYFLYLTIFITGAVILIIEIAGTRILSPFYGSTIYVWSSLITVTLACLALGYFVGGKVADRKPELKMLYFVVFLAGLITFLIPKVDAWVLLWSYRFDMIWGPLLATVILFSLSLFSLAMVTPMAVKLKTKALDYLGTTAGSLYAISTVGSLAGALLTGFCLIPNLGVTIIIDSAAIVLMIISVIWLVINQKFLKLFFSLVLVAILFIIPASQPFLSDKSKIIYQTSSFYGNIKVVDRSGARYLLINGIPQSGINKITKKSTLPYTNDILLARFLTPQELNKALLLGLGAGTIAKQLKEIGIDSDIVEIDPQVKEVAIDFFDFSPQNYNLYLTDARYFIKNTKSKYDLVVLDVSLGEVAPAHLLSLEAFEEMKKKLTDDGILAINVTGFLNSQFIQSLYLTLKQVYADVLVMGTDPNRWSNVAFFATSNLSTDITKTIKERCENQDCIEVYQEILTDDLVEIMVNQKKKIITDDYNPTTFWQTKSNQAFRQWAWDFFGQDMFIS